MSNTHVIGDYTAAISIDGSTNYLLIQPGDSSTAYRKINRNVFLGVSGQPVDISTSQTLTNKVLGNTNSVTLKDANFTLQDDSDTTKQAQFQLSGITTATTRTYTLPNASSTLADISTSQTFTNKTLTSPTISGGSIDNTTITVDSISGHTTPNSGTIYGLTVTSSKIGANGVVTTSITDSAVTPAKLLSGTGSSWSYQSWTPTWTNLTIGNGTTIARYIQIGKTVQAYLYFTLGSTSAVGTGPTFTLPVTASATQIPASDFSTIGMGRGNPAGSQTNFGVLMNSSGLGVVIVYNASATYLTDNSISATVPATWASTNYLRLQFSYEAA